MNKMTVRDVEVSGRKVLVRVDFNVPLDEATGAITDDSRIKATLPTLTYLIDRGAKTILCSHLGRPGGKVVEELRLGGVRQRLSQLLGKEVAMTHDCIGPEVEEAVAGMKDGDVLLLENVRFHPGEEKNDPAFARALARLADIYVNNAFGALHRSHASIVGITAYLPAVAGLLVERELEVLGEILASPPRPFAALTGGAKVSDKIELMENIMGKVDCLLIGGGMAATFLKALSYEVGRSLVENDKLGLTSRLMNDAAQQGARLLLPLDVVVAREINARAESLTVPVEGIPPGMRIVDIGPRTVESFSEELRKCRTVFWNGPMGVYEIARFAGGTRAMAELLAGLKAATIIGGGSTAEVVTEMKLVDRMRFVSTGGGASLRFLGGETLPGMEALRNKEASGSG